MPIESSTFNLLPKATYTIKINDIGDWEFRIKIGSEISLSILMCAKTGASSSSRLFPATSRNTHTYLHTHTCNLRYCNTVQLLWNGVKFDELVVCVCTHGALVVDEQMQRDVIIHFLPDESQCDGVL